MKIYFEDGKLFAFDLLNVDYELNAEVGFSEVKLFLDKIKEYDKYDGTNSSVYTNSIIALDNNYAWNNKLGVSEIYIRDKNKHFTRIDKLTHKALRREHNIMKMYIAGAFRNEVEE